MAKIKSTSAHGLALLQQNTLIGVVIGTLLATILFTVMRHPLTMLDPMQSVMATNLTSSAPNATAPADTVFIGILSHPRNHERRARLRDKCFPLLREEARRRNLTLHIMFAMGRAAEPDYNRGAKIQGRKADPDVVALGQAVLDESARFGDVLPVPTVDQYIDTMDKVIALFRHGLRKRASLIAKLDDDTCRNVTGAVWDRWVALDRPAHFYFGYYLFSGTEYSSMFGADNTTAPFMAGPFYGLSRKLAHIIFERDFVRTTQHHVYATSSEDATVGKLVKHVENRYLIPRNDSVVYEGRPEWGTSLLDEDAK